jgi:hypothetical protein
MSKQSPIIFMHGKQSPITFMDYNDLSKTTHHNEKTQWVIFLRNLTGKYYYKKYLDNIVVIKDWKSNVSASDSKIISGDIIDSEIPEHLKNIKHKILIKITKKKLVDCDNSLKVELLLYKHVLNKLLYRNICPHIIGYLNDKQVVVQEVVQEVDEKTEKLENVDYNYLFLEMSNGLTLRNYSEGEKSEKKSERMTDDTLIDYWEKKEKSKEKSKKKRLKMSLNDLIGVTFQLLYTLMVFDDRLLSHNDLHPGNIIIENKYIEYSYKIYNFVVKLKCNYLVKIFDFDNASIYHENVCRNIKLDYYPNLCQNNNVCNTPKNNDLYLVLFNLLNIIELNDHKKLIPVFDNFLINTVDGGLRKFIDPKKFRLKNTNSHILKNLKSPYECLQVLFNSDIAKDCIKVSDKGEATYIFKPKTFYKYKPKLQIYDKKSQNLCGNLYKHINNDNIFFDNVFSNDIEFLRTNKRFEYDVYGNPLINFISYCQKNHILMTRELAKKLVLPFIYGIPNYIYNILESHEIQMYNNFAEKVNGLLPIDILDMCGDSGINNK